jgi:hypothetical protein
MDLLKKGHTWKVGPTDFLWDQKRGVWTCHDIMRGRVENTIYPLFSGTIVDLDREGQRYLVRNNLMTNLPAGMEVLIGYTGMNIVDGYDLTQEIYKVLATRAGASTSSIGFGIVISKGDMIPSGIVQTWGISLNGTLLGTYNGSESEPCSGFLARTNTDMSISIFGNACKGFCCQLFYTPVTFSRSLVNPSGANNTLTLTHTGDGSNEGTIQIFGLAYDIRESGNWIINETLLESDFDGNVGETLTFNFPGPYP